jgi:hypothetical protein
MLVRWLCCGMRHTAEPCDHGIAATGTPAEEVTAPLMMASMTPRVVLGAVVLLPEAAQNQVADVVEDLVDFLRCAA